MEEPRQYVDIHYTSTQALSIEKQDEVLERLQDYEAELVTSYDRFTGIISLVVPADTPEEVVELLSELLEHIRDVLGETKITVIKVTDRAALDAEIGQNA